MPDMSEFPPQDFDWMYTVYSAVKEVVPKDIPKALGKSVTSVYLSTAQHTCSETTNPW